METFSALLALCAGNSPVTVNSPQKGQWRGALIFFSLICAWINSWVNNGEAWDLRRHRAHYDVIVVLFHKINKMIGCLLLGWSLDINRHDIDLDGIDQSGILTVTRWVFSLHLNMSCHPFVGKTKMFRWIGNELGYLHRSPLEIPVFQYAILVSISQGFIANIALLP